MIRPHTKSIRYDAFKALPKSNKKEFLYVALATTAFMVLTVAGMLLFIPANTEPGDASSAFVLPALGFTALLFWMAAARQDRGSAIRERAFLQFIEDNRPLFRAELYSKAQPFTTSSLIINASAFDSGPRRGFLLKGAVEGHTFMVYNPMLFKKRRGFRYSNPVRTVVEMPLRGDYGTIRCIGINKFDEFAHRGVKQLHPQRSERERYKATVGHYTVYHEQPGSEYANTLSKAIATSIQDIVRWSAFEVNDGTVYLFGDRGLWFNEKELRETFEQIHRLGESLATAKRAET